MKKIILAGVIVFLYSQCINAQNKGGFKIPEKYSLLLQEIYY